MPLTFDELWYIFSPAIIYAVIGAVIIIGGLEFLRHFDTPSERAAMRRAARHANDPIQTVEAVNPNIRRDSSGEVLTAEEAATDYFTDRPGWPGYPGYPSVTEEMNARYRSKEYAKKHPNKSGAWVFRGGIPNAAESDAEDLPTPEQWQAAVDASRNKDAAAYAHWWDFDKENLRYKNFGADRPNPPTPEPDEGGPVDFDWLKNWREGK